MRTIRPDLRSKKQYLSLLDIKLGTILEIDNNEGKSRYALAGMSLTGYAFVSIYDDIEICHFLNENSDITSLPMTLTVNNISLNVHIDCSRVISCSFGVVGNLVKEKPSCYAGHLSETQTEMVIELVKSAPTIAKYLKDEYFI
jgi:hypothetical protein